MMRKLKNMFTVMNAVEDRCIRLHSEGIATVWLYAEEFLGKACISLGIASHACELFKRYLTTITLHGKRTSMRTWKRSVTGVRIRSELILAVCIKISSKMILSRRQLTSVLVKYVIRKTTGVHYFLQEIKDCEYEVYKALDFRVPLRSNVELVKITALDLGFNDMVGITAGKLMDSVDHNHLWVANLLQKIAKKLKITQSQPLFTYKAMFTGIILVAANLNNVPTNDELIARHMNENIMALKIIYHTVQAQAKISNTTFV